MDHNRIGVIKPGIVRSKKKVFARVMIDGSIKHKEKGSIHKVAAKILGAESCNGESIGIIK